MGLTFKKRMPVGVGQEEAKSIRQHWDTIEQVESTIAGEYGILDKPQPRFECPELTTEQLTTPDSKSYTETYQKFQAWFEYYTEIKAKVQARVLQYENMLEVLSAQTRRQHRDIASNAGGKKLSAEEVKDLLTTNPEYQEILLELQRYQQTKLLVDAKVESIERTLRIISRQVEIRRLDIEQTKTSANMPGRNQRDPQTSRFGAPLVGTPLEER